eukprot:7944339-Pyramimonas_sp.AAC.1
MIAVSGRRFQVRLPPVPRGRRGDHRGELSGDPRHRRRPQPLLGRRLAHRLDPGERDPSRPGQRGRDRAAARHLARAGRRVQQRGHGGVRSRHPVVHARSDGQEPHSLAHKVTHDDLSDSFSHTSASDGATRLSHKTALTYTLADFDPRI